VPKLFNSKDPNRPSGNIESKIGKSSSTAITMLETLYYKM
jgi:hypothetical protein